MLLDEAGYIGQPPEKIDQISFMRLNQPGGYLSAGFKSPLIGMCVVETDQTPILVCELA
jgi:hypothetical protein